MLIANFVLGSICIDLYLYLYLSISISIYTYIYIYIYIHIYIYIIHSNLGKFILSKVFLPLFYKVCSCYFHYYITNVSTRPLQMSKSEKVTPDDKFKE